jgi:CheY-like chemotaxis protein
MRTILVVDDDPVSVRLIELIASRNGYAVVAAANASEALAWLDGSVSVEMIITDQQMPHMTGLELYSAVHADIRFRLVPFILCTGFADQATVREAMSLGIRHFIVKPITPKVVLEKVTMVGAERPPTLESRDSAMARLRLNDNDYKSFAHACRDHLLSLRSELALAFDSGDRVTTITVASRLREPAALVKAVRLLGAIDILDGTRTWTDTNGAVRLVLREVDDLEIALEEATRPHLVGRSMGSLAP